VITSRAWRDSDYDALSELLATNAASGLPNPPVLLPGDLAWRLPGSEPNRNLQLFFSDDRLAGFAWFEPLTGFEFDIHHEITDTTALLEAILDWARSLRLSLPAAYPRFVDITNMEEWRSEITNPTKSDREAGHYLTTVCPEFDEDRIRWLTGNGFEPTAHYAPVYLWDLSQQIPAPEPGRP
jgi:hypothetical protein